MFRVEFEKIISNIVFYMCILGSVILLLSGTLYKDSMTGEEYTLINIVINHNTEVITTADLHGTDVIADGVGGYFGMFLSIIVAIPFVMVVCGEKKNSNTRFEIYRIGKNRFFLGKFFAAVIAGGLVAMIGYAIFSLIAFLTLPEGTGMLTELRYTAFKESSAFGKWYFETFGVAGMMVLKQFRMFLYGAVSAVPAFGLSRVIKNRYIVISIPFMMFYLLDKFIVKQENPALYKALIANLGNLFDTGIGSMLLIFGGATVLILVLCRFYLGRKCDCGEE